MDFGGLSKTFGAITVSGGTTQDGNLTGTSYAANNAVAATVSASLQANGSAGLAKSGAGNLILTGANTYAGTTAVSGGSLTVSGAAGTINASSAVTVIRAATLNLDNTVASVDRIKDTATLTLGGTAGGGGGILTFTGNGPTGSTTETIGALALDAGASTITLTRRGGATPDVIGGQRRLHVRKQRHGLGSRRQPANGGDQCHAVIG